jgi:2-polyprenyl-3-methyl-5-hydroxy-6-metoxy-1,4-benzoquinol methylase
MSASSNVARISPCPVCQNIFFRKIFTKKGKDFWKCTNCGLEKIYPLPSLEDLKDYYDESYTEGMYKIFTDARKMKQMTAKERLKQISSYCPQGRWLDVGCSDGGFVEQARLAGILAEGIDLSKVAIQEAGKRNLPVYYSAIEDFKPEYEYNTITAFDVLEHVIDPTSFMKSLHRLLLPGGKIALSVPDQGSLICKLMGKAWYFYIPEEHLHYFNISNITKLLNKMGFVVERCARAYKPLTYSYSLTQFKEYNPSIYTILSVISKFIPEKIQNFAIPLYIGEMMVIART